MANSAVVKETKRVLFGWKMFDWSISPYSTTITSALLGPYILALAEANEGVRFLGMVIAPGSFFPLCVSLSALLQIVVLPIIGVVSDHTHLKKSLLLWSVYLGSWLTCLLFFLTASTVLLGGIVFVFATVCVSSSTVIYNSYLPSLAPPKDRDKLSSVGFAYGYLAGFLWLLVNLLLIHFLSEEGETSSMAIRISLGATGLWMAFFTAVTTHRLLPERSAQRKKPSDVRWLSFSATSLKTTLGDLKRSYPVALVYLIAYLLFNDGIQTIIVVATSFASAELNASTTTLLLIVLVIQFLAAPGAVAFGMLAKKVGARKAIIYNLYIWIGIVAYAYLQLDSITKLWFLAVVLSLALGGSQALARSLYSQLIPQSREAEFFSLFEVSSRGTAWIGPVVFAVANQLFGSQRSAILVLVFFFIGGVVLLFPLKVKKGMIDAGNDPKGVLC